MAKTTFSGPVRSLNGFINFGPTAAVSLTATKTLTMNDHAGRPLLCNLAAGEWTLPSITTGSAGESSGGNDYNVASNLGATYTFIVQTLFSAGVIKTDGTDKFIGFAKSLMTGAATGIAWFPGATNDVMNFDGTTTGGIVGSIIKVTAVASAQYFVEAYIKSSGTQATPFADA